jgi:hypothetical protein
MLPGSTQAGIFSASVLSFAVWAASAQFAIGCIGEKTCRYTYGDLKQPDGYEIHAEGPAPNLKTDEVSRQDDPRRFFISLTFFLNRIVLEAR